MSDKWIIDQNGISVFQQSNSISYPDTLNDFCYSLEDNSDWFLFRNDLIKYFISKHSIKGDFLDIGGGNGFQAKALEDLDIIDGNVLLVEPGYAGCLNAKKRGCKFIYCGFFQDLNFLKLHTIKMCGLFDVIEHIKDDIFFLNQLYNKLPSKSRVFINVPAKSNLWSQTDVYAGHFRRYDESDLLRIEQSTPFKVIDKSYYFDFYILPLILFRVIPEKMGFKKNESQIISSERRNLTASNKNRLLNIVFNYLHRQKIKMLLSGKRIENGTSLFFVLEKQ